MEKAEVSKCPESLRVYQVEGDQWKMIFWLFKQSEKELEAPYFWKPNPKQLIGFILEKNCLPIGFATWSFLDKNRQQPCLRQFYILPGERRKGYGMLLFMESYRLFSNSRNLNVAAPTEATKQLLLKLDLAEYAEDGQIRGKGILKFVYLPLLLRPFSTIFKLMRRARRRIAGKSHSCLRALKTP